MEINYRSMNSSRVILLPVIFTIYFVLSVSAVFAATLDVHNASLSTTVSVEPGASASASISSGIINLTANKHASDFSDASEARIRINGSEVGVNILNDFISMSWDVSSGTGYAPHIDVFLDTNDDGIKDTALTFEYAKVDPNNCDNSAGYPTGSFNTFKEKGIVDGNAYAWESIPGPCGNPAFDAQHKSLTDWKLIYGSAKVLRFELEVDAWISDSSANISNIIVNGNEYFVSIQDAISAATSGNTINVAAGTYNENIVIDKSINLTGEDQSSTIVDVSSSTLRGIDIQASNVNISFITVSSTTDTSPYLIGATGTIDAADLPLTKILLKNVTISGPGSTKTFGITQGFRAENINDLKLFNITISGMREHAFDILDSSNVHIDTAKFIGEDFSTVCTPPFTGCPGPEAIRIEDSDNILVENSVIDGGFLGINFAYNPGTWDDSGTQGIARNNTIDRTWDAILLADKADGLIQNNTLRTSNTGVLVGFQDNDPNPPLPLTANITENIITSNVRGIRIQNTHATETTINFNNIFGNSAFGVLNFDSGIVNAENNWWGNANGPTHATNLLTPRGDDVSNNVNFIPWCSSSTCQTTFGGVTLSTAAPIILNQVGGTAIDGGNFSANSLTPVVNRNSNFYFGMNATSSISAPSAPIHNVVWKIVIDGPSALDTSMVSVQEVGWFDTIECGNLTATITCPTQTDDFYTFSVENGNLVALGSGGNFDIDSIDKFATISKVNFSSSAPLGTYVIKGMIVGKDVNNDDTTDSLPFTDPFFSGSIVNISTEITRTFILVPETSTVVTQSIPTGTTTVDATTAASTTIDVQTSSGTEISVATTTQPAANAGVLGLGKFLSISMTNESALTQATIKVFYTDAEVAAAGVVESTLRLYFFNETTGTWNAVNPPDGGVDTTNNFVFANTNHFSAWGIFGNAVAAPAPSPSPAPTGGAGGGGAPATFPIVRISGITAIAQTAGTSAAYTVSIQNTGTAGGTYTLSLSGIPSSWYTVSSPVTIATGSSATMSYTLSLPADATDSTFTVIGSVPVGATTATNSYTVQLRVLTAANVTNITTIQNVTQTVTPPLLPAVTNAITGFATLAASNPTNQLIAGGVVGVIILVGVVRIAVGRRKPWRTSYGYSYQESLVKKLRKQTKSALEEEE